MQGKKGKKGAFGGESTYPAALFRNLKKGRFITKKIFPEVPGGKREKSEDGGEKGKPGDKKCSELGEERIAKGKKGVPQKRASSCRKKRRRAPQKKKKRQKGRHFPPLQLLDWKKSKKKVIFVLPVRGTSNRVWKGGGNELDHQEKGKEKFACSIAMRMEDREPTTTTDEEERKKRVPPHSNT